MNFLPTLFIAIPPSEWMVAILTIIIIFFGLLAIRGLLRRKLEKRAPTTVSLVDDLFLELAQASRRVFFLTVAIYVGFSTLALPPKWISLLERGSILVALFQFAIWANVCTNFWINRYLKKKAESDVESATTLGLISFVTKALIFTVTVLLVLNNLGVNITALVAGLGVGGIAVALSLQSVLGDLFASLTIVLDKPFIVGDFVTVGDFKGTIEHIGLKTTRLRSLSGEQLIFSNSDLLQSRIRNYKRMNERRVIFTLGVTYQTPVAALREIPDMIRKVVEKQTQTRFERCHFMAYGDSSLNFEVVYWILNADFKVYADIAEAVNLDIFEGFAEKKIDFAYPTRTLLIQK